MRYRRRQDAVWESHSTLHYERASLCKQEKSYVHNASAAFQRSPSPGVRQSKLHITSKPPCIVVLLRTVNMTTENTQTTMPNPTDLLSAQYAPIQTSILNYLDPSSIAMLAQTCKALDLLPLLYRMSYDISKYIECFFSDSLAFRSLQARSDGILVGELVFQFLTRQLRDPTLLDIVVDESGYKMMNDYIEQQGYAVTFSTQCVTNFAKSGPGVTPQRRVRVVNNHKIPR